MSRRHTPRDTASYDNQASNRARLDEVRGLLYSAYSTIPGRTLTLSEYMDLSEESLQPGKVRRHRRLFSVEEERKQAKLIREERHDRPNLAWGGHVKMLHASSPVNMTVLEARTIVDDGLRELEDAICEQLELDERAPQEGRIVHILDLFERVAEHDDLTDHVVTEIHRLWNAARTALDPEPVKHYPHIECPYCGKKALDIHLDSSRATCRNSECRCSPDCYGGWHHPWRGPLELQRLASMLVDA